MSTEFGTEPTFRTYLLVLRRRKRWLISLMLLGLAGSLAFALTAHKQYSATAQVLFQPTVSSSALGTAQEQQVTPAQVQTELQLVTSAPVRAAVSKQFRGARPASASEVGTTNVISVTSTSGVPSRAAAVANAYALSFIRYQQNVASRTLSAAEAQLQSQIASISRQVTSFRGKAASSPQATALLNQEAVLREQLAQVQVNGAENLGGVSLVTPAQVPASPSSPKPVQDALLGLAAGLVLGLGAAFVCDNLDDRLSSKEATELAGEAPVLATVPAVASWRTPKSTLVISATGSTSPAAECYRSLRTSLQFTRQERQLRSIVVTSPAAGEGKTATLANLGVVFAQASERVVVVSCDMRRPRIGQFYGLDERVGLTTVLLGQRSLEDAIRPVPGFDCLHLLPAGQIPPNPAELLSGTRTQRIFADLAERFDLVLIDSPPVLPVTDAVVLSQHADATLLVVSAGQTRPADLHRAVEKLNQVSATVLGTVLNRVTKQSGDRYGYGYGYSYAYKPYPNAPGGNGEFRRNGRAPEPQSAPGDSL
jgi:polysaccharide biosynthesis transport protein